MIDTINKLVDENKLGSVIYVDSKKWRKTLEATSASLIVVSRVTRSELCFYSEKYRCELRCMLNTGEGIYVDITFNNPLGGYCSK